MPGCVRRLDGWGKVLAGCEGGTRGPTQLVREAVRHGGCDSGEAAESESAPTAC